MNKIIPQNQNDILIDKVALYNITVEDIFDLSELEKQDLITVEKHPQKYLTTNSGEKFRNIEIGKCPQFDIFACGIARNGEPYSRMELSVNGSDGLHNLNCITVENLKEKINDADRYMADDLGVLCNFDESKIKYLEMNKTFEIVLNSLEYDRVLKTMINIMPKVTSKIKKPVTATKKTYSASNKSQTEIVKIYDKSNQLKEVHNIDTNANILRFELRLINDTNRLKTKFGSAYVRDLNENVIEKYYSEYVQNNFVTPYLKLLEFQNKKVTKILKENYKKDDKEWIDNVLHIICDYEIKNEIPLMFEIEQMKEWLNCLNLPKQNKYYIFKRFEAKSVKFNTVFKNNDKAKYEEILDKIEYLYFD